jgi:PKD repeat protein
MKKYLLTGLVAVLLMGACKKTYNATFKTSSSNYYLYQNITFTNTSNGGSYSWDFGDGTQTTAQSPTHAYNQPGTYNVTLTDGASVATKTITIYHGTAAFKVSNVTGSDIPMFTFSADASDYEIDYIDQGTINSGMQGVTYYTTDSVIYVGGTLSTGKTFLVAPPNYPYVLTKDSVNLLSINDNTSIYILNSIPGNKTNIQSIQTQALAHKTNLASILKH